MKDAVEVAKRVNAKWATVVPGPYDSGLVWGYQTANVIENLKWCADVLEPAGNDLYHQQIAEGNIIPNIDLSWEEIAYFQVGDNPGRNEPTTGEMNYKNVFKHIYDKGYQGIVGMEHGNSLKGKAGERALIDAYVACDDF